MQSDSCSSSAASLLATSQIRPPSPPPLSARQPKGALALACFDRPAWGDRLTVDRGLGTVDSGFQLLAVYHRPQRSNCSSLVLKVDPPPCATWNLAGSAPDALVLSEPRVLTIGDSVPSFLVALHLSPLPAPHTPARPAAPRLQSTQVPNQAPIPAPRPSIHPIHSVPFNQTIHRSPFSPSIPSPSPSPSHRPPIRLSTSDRNTSIYWTLISITTDLVGGFCFFLDLLNLPDSDPDRGRPRTCPLSLSLSSLLSSGFLDSTRTPVRWPRLLLTAAKRRQPWTRNDRTTSRPRLCRRAFNKRAVKQKV